MEKTKVIGLFDSGMGGLTVLKQARAALPNEAFVYYADLEHVPYGTKSRDEIIHHTRLSVLKLLETYELKALVLACNTATSAAADTLRDQFNFPVIGMEPALKPALKMAGTKKVLVFATDFTLREPKFHRLVAKLDAATQISCLAMPGLVQLAEKGIFHGKEVTDYLMQQTKDIDLAAFSTLVLGCTHFKYFEETITNWSGLQLMDGHEGTVNRLRSYLSSTGTRPATAYLVSGTRVPEKHFQPWLLS